MLSWVEKAQRERSTNRLRAVAYIELAQNFLYVVLHGQRADPEYRADLEVALAEVYPAQDLLLARGEKIRRVGCRLGLFGRTRQLRAHPGEMQEGSDELEHEGLLGTYVSGHPPEYEEAHGLAERVVSAVNQHVVRARGMQLCGELPVCEGTGARHTADRRMELRLDPAPHQLGDRLHVLLEEPAHALGVDPRAGEAIDLVGHGPPFPQSAQQQLMPEEVLQQTLSPAEQLRPGVYAQRGIDVEQQRLEHLRLEQPRAARQGALGVPDSRALTRSGVHIHLAVAHLHSCLASVAVTPAAADTMGRACYAIVKRPQTPPGSSFCLANPGCRFIGTDRDSL